MSQFIFVLLFSFLSVANCVPENARILTLNIREVQYEERLICESQNIEEKLVDGEKIQLVANLPYYTEAYMWCHDDKQNVLSASCNYTGNQCTHLFQFSPQHGRWRCIYLMDTDGSIEPFENYQGKNYTKAVCEFNLTAEDNSSVTSDVLLDTGKKLECSSPNALGKFCHWEQFNIIANTPYNIKYMWCDTATNNALVACNNTGNQCTSLVQLNYAIQSWPGKWQCTYIMDTKGLVAPNVYVNGVKKYSKATCEFNLEVVSYRPVTLDIVVNNGTRMMECTSRNKQDNVMEGDTVRIIANVPYRVKNMRCENDKGVRIAVYCIQTGNECYTAFTFTKSLRGKWQCSYTLRTKGTVEPVEITKFGTKVTRATCELNLNVIDNRDMTLDIKVADNETKLAESQP